MVWEGISGNYVFFQTETVLQGDYEIKLQLDPQYISCPKKNGPTLYRTNTQQMQFEFNFISAFNGSLSLEILPGMNFKI